MKALVRGKIGKMSHGASGWVEIEVNLSGSVNEGATAPTMRETSASLRLSLKPVIAEQLRFGQELYVAISTEPPEPARPFNPTED
jgi:hypothetical protein